MRSGVESGEKRDGWEYFSHTYSATDAKAAGQIARNRKSRKRINGETTEYEVSVEGVDFLGWAEVPDVPDFPGKEKSELVGTFRVRGWCKKKKEKKKEES